MDDNTAHDDADQEHSEPSAAGSVAIAAAPGVIDPDLVESAAVEVVRELREHDFEAYLVGGCVRDLLLGRTPKDFDVATNATPEEVRKVFRRSRTVGRRFRIVHVRVGRQLFEVSTYRKNVDEDDYPEDVTTSEDGVILRDNSYGTMEDDTFRRDFTVNAMVEAIDGTIVDPFNGQNDLLRKVLRTPSDTSASFNDDPLRILRAFRFAVTKGLNFSDDIVNAVKLFQADKMNTVSTERVRNELEKMFKYDTSLSWRYLRWLEDMNPELFKNLFRDGLWLMPSLSRK